MYYLKKYKKASDYTKSPMRYPGGKFYALKYIMPFIQCVEHDEYREPFFGGGAIFFAKQKVKTNIINDLEKDIIDFYRFIQDQENAKELAKLFENEIATKQRHSEIKNFEPINELEYAFKTYYLNRTSYSGIINKPAWGYAVGKSSPPQNWGSFIMKASRKLTDVHIYNRDYQEVLALPQVGNRVLMYLDPPYYHADTKRAYTKPFSIGDHERLAEDLHNTPHLFCLSYDDCNEIRDLYRWANIYSAEWNYNTANRHGKNRSVGKELIITNYEVNR